MGVKGKSSITVRTVGIGIVVACVIGAIVAFAVGAVRMRIQVRDGTKAAADMAPSAAPLPTDGPVAEDVQDKTPGLSQLDSGFQEHMSEEMQTVAEPDPHKAPELANPTSNGEEAFNNAFADKHTVSYRTLKEAHSKASESRPCVSFHAHHKVGSGLIFRGDPPAPSGNAEPPPPAMPDNFHVFETNCPR
tara:strand:+ start:1476 stop:2045 length:570 start_codon:yes stop_codon:yes gene_type:complete